jgi:hypothetical protein
MAFVHGKDTVVLINASDISAYTNSTTDNDSRAVHNTTTYGRDRDTFQSGLGTGTITIGGIFDNTAAGPRKIIQPLKEVGDAVAFVFRPDGTGSGLQEHSCSVIITAFNVTSPVADMCTWTAELQKTGPIDDTDQA